MIRLEVDYAYNVRASRKERRHKDGRLVKTTIFRNCATIEAAFAEARENQKAGEEIAPGYAEVIAVRAYDQDAFLASPTNAKPLIEATHLNALDDQARADSAAIMTSEPDNGGRFW